MKQYKVGYLKRYVMYLAVRFGGSKVWKEHNQDEVQEYKKYCEIQEIDKKEFTDAI